MENERVKRELHIGYVWAYQWAGYDKVPGSGRTYRVDVVYITRTKTVKNGKKVDLKISHDTDVKVYLAGARKPLVKGINPLTDELLLTLSCFADDVVYGRHAVREKLGWVMELVRVEHNGSGKDLHQKGWRE